MIEKLRKKYDNWRDKQPGMMRGAQRGEAVGRNKGGMDGTCK